MASRRLKASTVVAGGPSAKTRIRRAPPLLTDAAGLEYLERASRLVSDLVRIGTEIGFGIKAGVPVDSTLARRLVSLQHALEALRLVITAPTSGAAPALRVRATEAGIALNGLLENLDSRVGRLVEKLGQRVLPVADYELTVAILDKHHRLRQAARKQGTPAPSYLGLLRSLPSLRGSSDDKLVREARAELRSLDAANARGKVPTRAAAKRIVARAHRLTVDQLVGLLSADARERSGKPRDGHHDS